MKLRIIHINGKSYIVKSDHIPAQGTNFVTGEDGTLNGWEVLKVTTYSTQARLLNHHQQTADVFLKGPRE